MPLVISNGFSSSDYDSKVKNVISRQVSETNGILWVKNHDFDYFHYIVVNREKIGMFFPVYHREVLFFSYEIYLFSFLCDHFSLRYSLFYSQVFQCTPLI